MRTFLLFCLLFSCCATLCAQIPEVTRRGDTLFAPEAVSYQWLHDGNLIPGATQRFYVPPNKDGWFTVRLKSFISDPLDYTPGPTLVVTGAVLDEYLRPISGVEVTVGGVKAKSDGAGRFHVTAQRAARLTARAQIVGFHTHTVGFMPTAADTQFVYLHLAKQVVTHKLPADTGGTISQGGFWLTLPPNAVVTADGKAYSGEIQLSVVARRPGDRDFAQRMPGGDFMAVDAAGASKVLYSYGFTGVEMTTSEGAPLNLAPGSNAMIEFLITEEQRPGAPAEMPLWHFDETAGLWKESGTVRKEGLTYRAEVGHFSWWNVDLPFPPAYIECNVVNCWGKPVAGAAVTVGQRTAVTDADGNVKGAVPATIELGFQAANVDLMLTPLAVDETRALGAFDAGWGRFQAFGLADTNRILTVFAYGEMEGVEYSLDGETWQSEPVFVLESDSVPGTGWVRVEGCDTLRFDNISPTFVADCRMYDAAKLGSIPYYTTMPALLSAKEPVYRIWLDRADIEPLLQAVRLQPCVQELLVYRSTTPPAVLAAGLNGLCTFWLNLQWLELLENQLTALPESLGNLTNLQMLWLSNNRLTALPESLGNLTNLQELHLSINQLTAVPESLGNLTNLKELDLSNNQLVALPESLGNLNNLQSLELRLNRLAALPKSLGNLTNLKSLVLDGNQLMAVPKVLGNLTNLRGLELANNQLTTLPASFANLADTLKTLGLQDNPISAEEQARIRAMLPNTQITF